MIYNALSLLRVVVVWIFFPNKIIFSLNDVDEVDDKETNEEVVEEEEAEEEELLACLVTELCCFCWAWADDTEVDIDEVSNSIFCVESSARTLLERSDSGLLLEDSFFA